VVSTEGREVVGPGYSTCKHLVGKESKEKGKLGQCHVESSMIFDGRGGNHRGTNPGGRHTRDMKEAVRSGLNLDQREHRVMASMGDRECQCPDGAQPISPTLSGAGYRK
jgi:hypothetical protein